MKKLHRMVLHMEEEEMPARVTIEPGSIDLGGAGYLRSMRKVLEVKNTGKVGGNRGWGLGLTEDPRYPVRSGSCRWRWRS